MNVLARRWTPYVGGALAIGVVVALFLWLGRDHTTRTFFDSSAYLEAAHKPWTLQQLFYPKPPFVALVYRLTSTDLGGISAVQRALALASWSCLGIALVMYFARRRTKIAAGVVAGLFVLAPVRVGYADAVLSESINDSLFALVVAALLATLSLQGRRRIAAAAVLAIVALAWTFTRDTNAITVLAAAAFAAAVAGKALWRTRWGAALVGLQVVAAAIVLWSVDVTRDPDPFAVQPGWPTDFTSRGTFSKLNNVVDRVLPDAGAREYFRDHGMPQVDELAGITERGLIIMDPRFAPARVWIAEHSRGVFLRWLLRHPIERITDQVAYAWTLLGVDEQGFYMPRGWKGRGHSAIIYVTGITANRVVLVLLLLALPAALYYAWRHRGRNVAIALVATGWLGSLAAFYADASEYGRHCYGSGQQVIFGLCFALLLWLDVHHRRQES